MNWIELQELNYRQVHVYDMEWETGIPLTHFQVAIAKFGGPIARVLKPKTLVKSESAALECARHLTIHSSSGTRYAKIPWDPEKPLLGLGWTSEEILVVVYKNGGLELFNIWGERAGFPPENIFSPKSLEILKFQVLETTLVLYASDSCFYSIKGLPNSSSYTPEVLYRMSNVHPESPRHPSSFLAFSDPASLSFDLQLVIGQADGGIQLVTEGQNVTAFNKVPFSTEENGRVIDIAISGNATMFAFLQESGVVLVVPSDLSKLLGKQLLQRKDVKQVTWCGSDAVCLVYSSYLAILGPDNSNASVDYSTTTPGVFCMGEVDGLRIITTEKHEFLEKVDKSVESIFAIGVFTPASLLKTAYEMYLGQNSSSGDSIRSLQQDDHLLEAVDTCMTAACCEFSCENQEVLLKTAAFGKTFLPIKSFDSDRFVETVRNLRVLNNIRKAEVARPLTYKQLSELRSSGELLIKRLLDSHHHYLALQISKLWKLREEQIYVHWAIAKLPDQRYDDTEMCNIICSKLATCRSINYTEITKKALDCGRRELAIKLLENEPVVARKVPLLLYMGELSLALDKAVASLNPNLINLVIMKVHESERRARVDPAYSPGSCTEIDQVLRKPVAREMLLTYAKQMDENLLLNSHQALKRHQETGNVFLERVLRTSDLSQKLKNLEKAKEAYGLCERDPFFFACVKDQQALIEKQKKVGKETSVLSITGSNVSICDTIYQLLMERHVQPAETLAKAFQVPDKKLAYIRLRVCAGRDDWSDVETLLSGKKTPAITFKPYADLAIKKGNYDMAERCVLRVLEPDYQVSVLLYMGKFMSAAQVAVRAKSQDLIAEVSKQCTDPEVRGFIESSLAGAKAR